MSSFYPSITSNSSSNQLTNQKQLIEQLTRLNQSLQLEVDGCHKYIQTLEKDLNESQNKYNTTIQSLENGYGELEGTGGSGLRKIEGGEDSELIREELIIRVNKLEEKLNQKRCTIKRMQKERQGMEFHIYDIQRQKQQILSSMNNLQYLLDNRSITDKQAISKLQNSLAQQRQTIQLYYKQLNNKSSVIDKIYMKLEDLERQRGVIINQNQGLRQINFTLAQKLHESEKKSQEKENKYMLEIKGIEKKLGNEISELKKSNKMLKEEAIHSKSAILSNLSMKICKVDNVVKGVALEQNSEKQEVDIEKIRQTEHLKLIQQEIITQKQKSERLKNDLMAMKLQNSSLIVKNNQLSQQLIKLQRSRNQLLAKAADYNNISTMKNISRDQGKYFDSLKNPATKVPSAQTSIMKRIPKTPQPNDQEIPVHDKNSSVKKYNQNDIQGRIQDMIQTRKGNKISNISAAFLSYK